jgi:endogenous inhibitor of DNA gyrase (YacG/DUF329 family)
MTRNVVDERKAPIVEPDLVCVFCRKRPVAPVWRPFCSERCKLQDLARWADERYRVPGERVLPPDERHEPSE